MTFRAITLGYKLLHGTSPVVLHGRLQNALRYSPPLNTNASVRITSL
jgi:hypothetical protein